MRGRALRILFGLLGAMLSIAVAHAQTPRVERIEITEFGIYDLKRTKTIDAPGTASGSMLETEGKLVQRTSVIPARLGLSFGYSYRIIGSPANGRVTLKDVNIVPEPGLRNPQTRNIIFREEVQVESTFKGVLGSDYSLGEELTLLPGTWIFQLWLGNRKLAEQVFTLVKP
jgi:hypothetical protein